MWFLNASLWKCHFSSYDLAVTLLPLLLSKLRKEMSDFIFIFKCSIKRVKIHGKGIETHLFMLPLMRNSGSMTHRPLAPPPQLEHHDVWCFRKHGGVEAHSDSRVEHQKSLTSRWIRMLNVVSVFWFVFFVAYRCFFTVASRRWSVPGNRLIGCHHTGELDNNWLWYLWCSTQARLERFNLIFNVPAFFPFSREKDWTAWFRSDTVRGLWEDEGLGRRERLN